MSAYGVEDYAHQARDERQHLSSGSSARIPSSSRPTARKQSMTDPVFHPLDPLSAAEFSATVEILGAARGVVAPAWRYANIKMAEPDKAAWPRSTPVVRYRPQCHRHLLRAGHQRHHKALVSLTDSTVLGWDHIPGVQTNFTVDEWSEADAALRAPDVIAGLAKRGITDLDLVFMDTWTYGDALIPDKYKGPADRLVGYVGAIGAGVPTRMPVGQRFHCVIDLTRWNCWRSGTFTVPKPEIMGGTCRGTCPNGSGRPAPAKSSSRWRSPNRTDRRSP